MRRPAGIGRLETGPRVGFRPRSYDSAAGTAVPTSQLPRSQGRSLMVESAAPVEHVFTADELFFSTTDSQGRIRRANSTFMRLSGYPRGALVGRAHNVVRHPDMPAGLFRSIWNAIEEGRAASAYITNRSADGGFYRVFATIVPSGDGYLSVRTLPRWFISPMRRRWIRLLSKAYWRSIASTSCCGWQLQAQVKHISPTCVRKSRRVQKKTRRYFQKSPRVLRKCRTFLCLSRRVLSITPLLALHRPKSLLPPWMLKPRIRHCRPSLFLSCFCLMPMRSAPRLGSRSSSWTILRCLSTCTASE